MYAPGFHISYPLQRMTNYIHTAVQHALTNEIQPVEDRSEPIRTDSYTSKSQIVLESKIFGTDVTWKSKIFDNDSTQQRKNLLILDWDDTLFPTSAIKKQVKEGTLTSNNSTFTKQLDELVVCLKDTFEEIIKIYNSENVIIVTNATYSWIYDQCTVFPMFDEFIKYLKLNNISIISAASDYGYLDSECRSKWKEFAFNDIFSNYFAFNDENGINCITSIGDSFDEYNASETASENIPNCILHRVKLKSKPSVNDLVRQMQNLKSTLYKFIINAEDTESCTDELAS